MNIAVLTGSFYPPTKAHLKLLLCGMEKAGAEKGFFVPTCFDFIKSKMEKSGEDFYLPDDDRLSMLKAMCKADERLLIDEGEIKGGNSNQTYQTLKRISQEYGGADIYYIVGSDKLTGPSKISSWKNAQKLLGENRLIVMNRKDEDPKTLILSDPLLTEYQDHIVFCDEPEDISDISSSLARKLICDKNPGYKQMLYPESAIVFDMKL